MNLLELSEQEIIRRNSMEQLRQMGIEPYPAAEYVTNAFSKEIKENFKDDAEPRPVSIAGRIMSRRIMGKASFMELQDSEGRIQVYISRDDICPEENKDLYNIVFKKLLDIGDFVGIKGFVFRTQMGEISVHAQEITVLSKSLKPLPVVKYKDGVAYDGFNDPELRYRQRYVDLVVNDGVKDIFMKRAAVIKTMRTALDEAGYTEVETPILQSIPGGASARPFITHHNSLDIDLYLRIATELYLKRLIVGGFEGVYEIGKNFRNEGMDRTHNPEFTCMELYVQYKDYNWMMSFTEQLLERICIAVNGTCESVVDGKTINFKAPYRRLPILDAIKEKTGYDLNGKSEDEIRTICKDLNLEIDETMGKGKLIDEIFGEFCEGTFIQPTFIIDYPVEMSPLTKMHRSKPGLTERFELMINGKEVANAYSELNDPIDQEERFKEQLRLSEKGDPVFYLLHGAGGDEEAWIALGRTSQILDNLIAQGKAKPMIVVMTNGNAWQDAAAGESPKGFVAPSMRPDERAKVAEGAFELSFPEIVKFVEKNFRTLANKKNRAIAGLSMGSFHSCNISKYYPDMNYNVLRW